jgi:hypothetical protein
MTFIEVFATSLVAVVFSVLLVLGTYFMAQYISEKRELMRLAKRWLIQELKGGE